jgi:hypothetical protein
MRFSSLCEVQVYDKLNEDVQLIESVGEVNSYAGPL